MCRLQSWCDTKNIIVDEQNGFRAGRSCQDQLLTLVNLIQSGKHAGASVFVAFVDFSKAYDSVNRKLLWKKLSDLGVGHQYLQALKTLYTDVKGVVLINGEMSEVFEI